MKKKCIRCTIIKNTIIDHMSKGRWVGINEIQGIIEQNCNLTSDDWGKHTETRPTKYPRWKHRLQATLQDMKGKGKLKHDSDTNRYFFVE